jgi:hypothetical protein
MTAKPWQKSRTIPWRLSRSSRHIELVIEWDVAEPSVKDIPAARSPDYPTSSISFHGII